MGQHPVAGLVGRNVHVDLRTDQVVVVVGVVHRYEWKARHHSHRNDVFVTGERVDGEIQPVHVGVDRDGKGPGIRNHEISVAVRVDTFSILDAHLCPRHGDGNLLGTDVGLRALRRLALHAAHNVNQMNQRLAVEDRAGDRVTDVAPLLELAAGRRIRLGHERDRKVRPLVVPRQSRPDHRLGAAEEHQRRQFLLGHLLVVRRGGLVGPVLIDAGHGPGRDAEIAQIVQGGRCQDDRITRFIAGQQTQVALEDGVTVPILVVIDQRELVGPGLRIVHQRLRVQAVERVARDQLVGGHAEYLAAVVHERLGAVGGGFAEAERLAVHAGDLRVAGIELHPRVVGLEPLRGRLRRAGPQGPGPANKYNDTQGNPPAHYMSSFSDSRQGVRVAAYSDPISQDSEYRLPACAARRKLSASVAATVTGTTTAPKMVP